jgi:hypothetical protein
MNLAILLHPWFAAALVAVLLAVFIHTYVFPLQYLFHLRYQILTALALAAYPWLAGRLFPEMLGNTLVLTNGVQVFVVAFLAILLAWVVMYTTFLLLLHRERLIKTREAVHPGWLPAAWRTWSERLGEWLALVRQALARWRNLVFALLALPLILAIHQASSAIPWYERVAGVAAAVVLAVLGDRLTSLVARRRAEQRKQAAQQRAAAPAAEGGQQRPLERLAASLPPGLAEGFLTAPAGNITGGVRPANISHSGATGYMALTLIVYGLGYLLLNPARPNPIQAGVPALAYVLLLLIMAGWTLSFLAFFFDYFRIPVVLLIVLLSFWNAQLVDTDHYYELASSGTGGGALTLQKLVDVWAANHQDDDDPIVVVTASGGGVASAVWTTQVLTGIQRRLTELGREGGIPDLGERFGRAILFMAGASGGSVGLMYYVNAFQNGAPPPAEMFAQIVDAAAAPSLAATAWGIAYTDIWSSLTPAFLPRTFVRDRGWAMEQNWAARLRQPPATLGGWRHDILNGAWRPAVVFNATIVEDGGLMLLTPVQAPPSAAYGATYYEELYGGYDIGVATAARLSATFPYVSPIARPIYDGVVAAPGMEGRHFHLADGGYHDNFGTVPALIWLKEVVAPYAAAHGRKILIVEIRLSPPDAAPSSSKEKVAWLYSLAGPPITLLNIWSRTQVNRDGLDYALLASAFQGRAAIKKITFFPLQSGCPSAIIPLSWQISAAQQEALFCMWDKTTNRTEKVLEMMRFFLEPVTH